MKKNMMDLIETNSEGSRYEIKSPILIEKYENIFSMFNKFKWFYTKNSDVELIIANNKRKKFFYINESEIKDCFICLNTNYTKPFSKKISLNYYDCFSFLKGIFNKSKNETIFNSFQLYQIYKNAGVDDFVIIIIDYEIYSIPRGDLIIYYNDNGLLSKFNFIIFSDYIFKLSSNHFYYDK